MLLDPSALKELSNEALMKVAKQYDQTAKEIKRMIQDRQTRLHNRKEWEKGHEQGWQAAHIMCVRIEAGKMTYDQALAATSKDVGLAPDFIAAHFRQQIKQKDHFYRLARDTTVLRMARTKQNKEIAEELNIHHSTVSIIIQKAFRREI